MDKTCISLGTLMDSPALETLMHPDKHTIYCLTLPACWKSGYEVLADPENTDQSYCRAYELDDAGNELVLKLARATGLKSSCSTCTNTSNAAPTRGFRATITGTIIDADASPQKVAVQTVQRAGVGCPEGVSVPSKINCTSGAKQPSRKEEETAETVDLTQCTCCLRDGQQPLGLAGLSAAGTQETQDSLPCHSRLIGNNYKLQWQLNSSHVRLRVELRHSTPDCWFALGFGPADNGMKQTDMIIGQVGIGDSSLRAVTLADFWSSGYKT